MKFNDNIIQLNPDISITLEASLLSGFTGCRYKLYIQFEFI